MQEFQKLLHTYQKIMHLSDDEFYHMLKKFHPDLQEVKFTDMMNMTKPQLSTLRWLSEALNIPVTTMQNAIEYDKLKQDFDRMVKLLDGYKKGISINNFQNLNHDTIGQMIYQYRVAHGLIRSEFVFEAILSYHEKYEKEAPFLTAKAIEDWESGNAIPDQLSLRVLSCILPITYNELLDMREEEINMLNKR